MSQRSDRVVLRPNIRQRLLWGVLAFALLGGSAWRVADGPPLRGWDPLGLGLLALCGLVMVAYVFGARLELTPDGFRYWPNLRSSSVVPWDRIDDLRIVSLGAYGTSIQYMLQPKPPPFGGGKPRRGGVPTWFGLNPYEQLHLMLDFRARFGRDIT